MPPETELLCCGSAVAEAEADRVASALEIDDVLEVDDASEVVDGVAMTVL